MSSDKERAKRLLVHYFHLASQGGWNWDSDSQAEIEDIVDCLLDATAEKKP